MIFSRKDIKTMKNYAESMTPEQIKKMDREANAKACIEFAKNNFSI